MSDAGKGLKPEAKSLLEKTRAYEPVPPGAVDGAAKRLFRTQERSRRSILPYLWAAGGVTALVLVAVIATDRTKKAAAKEEVAQVENITKRKPRFVNKVVRPSPSPKKAPFVYTKKKATAQVRLLPDEHTVPEKPEERAPASTSEVGPTKIVVWERPAKAPPRRDAIRSYKPRALRDFTGLDWAALKDKELPAYVQQLIERREAETLLAELDRLERPSKTNLLILRGDLRAAADRCSDAVVDFEEVLERDETEVVGARALFGHACCQQQLGNSAVAKANFERYLSDYPRGRHVSRAKEALASP